MSDAYVAQNGSGLNAGCGGQCSGSHLVQVGASASPVTLHYHMSFAFTASSSHAFEAHSGCSLSVCLLTDLDPFPDNLANADPVVLYHGTDLDMANYLAADTTDIGAYGGVDFGAGFYTLDSTALDMAKFFAKRTAAHKNLPYWGVAEFDVPLPMMLDFFCNYQDIILGYKDQTDLNATASWNAPSFTAGVPDPNFTPNQNPANTPIPMGQMNWSNFSWYNYWYDWCGLGNLPPTGMDATDYVPDWNILADHYNWEYALIWGNFYRGPSQNDCSDYRRGGLFGGRLGVIYQYAWGKNHGIDMFNQRGADGKPLVKRSVIKDPNAP